ncbi:MULTISPECIES: ABC transporter ATP-binding protein [Methanobacterium]|jgi:putative ABC transport system ATP-binding protein|uniref:ABC transporter ATP-binding protein n=1 Tax=Methanobacterium veterum TaxID=408577 RepID=A0A9E5A0J8_9EURY|nr:MULTISPECIES: ABC transporter ATP-binding protein [Methanobacterium]MCZ3365940.1 ABC transporter ATP-binding protein [Methanobacterium veterum]MCZ3371405.1 ABC transporter ATP-binding protein [Methanobacterium veterum]
MNGLINGNELWKTYKLDSTEVHALRGLNITVGEGEFVSIMGPSGSGKSTLLNMIGGLDNPTKGDLFIDGKDISRMSEGELTRMRAEKIGFIFQTFNLLPALTVRDNVEFPMRNLNGSKKMNKSSRIKKAEECIEIVGLGDRMDYLPAKLSGGERQRVAVARALVNNPKFILADEPTGNLDSESTENIINLLHEVNQNETTVIMVTHDAETTKNTRIMKIRDGKIAE